MAHQGIALQTGDRLSRGSRVLATEVDGETVMLALDTSLYHSLQGVGARVWELLENPTTLEDMARMISGEYGVAVEQCEPDIREFLEDMMRAELVVVQPR